MPVIGFDCPFKGRVDFDFCLRDAATHEQPCGFTYPVLKGMVGNESRNREGIHVTSLLGCLRKAALERQHDRHIPPGQAYWAFRGQLAHAVVELAQSEDAVSERRFTRQVEGLTIVGTPDVIYPGQRLLVDYKTTAMVPKAGPYAQHGMQVNIYRWLVQAHFRVERLEIVYLDMRGTARHRVPVMPLRDVEDFVLPRARLLKAALDGGELPPQIGEEGRWQCHGYCGFSHHEDCWGPDGPPPLPKKEGKKRGSGGRT